MTPDRKIHHVLVDRDGVLNREAPGGYVLSPDALVWEDTALEALKLLNDRSVRVSVVTNQSCVGRGLLSADGLAAVNARLLGDAEVAGAHISGIFACTHAPDAGCRCRKPKPGLLRDAIAASGIPLKQTVFIGDSVTDVEAAEAAGVRAMVVRTGKGAESEKWLLPEEVRVFNHLLDAAKAITEGTHAIAR